VLDLNTGKLLHEIKGVSKPHAVLYRGDLNRIYVTDGEEGALEIFDGSTYALLEKIALEKDADSMDTILRGDCSMFVSGGKDAGQKFSLLSVIDTTTAKKITTSKWTEILWKLWRSTSSGRGFTLNNPAKNEIEVIDRVEQQRVTGNWQVTMGKRNVAMALDEANQRPFSRVGRSGTGGGVRHEYRQRNWQSLPITTRAPTTLTYDAASKRIYAAGNGFVDVIEPRRRGITTNR